MLLRPSDQFMDFRQCSKFQNQTAQRAEQDNTLLLWIPVLDAQTDHLPQGNNSIGFSWADLSSSFTSQCSTASPGREDHLPKHSSLVAGSVGFCFGSFYFSCEQYPPARSYHHRRKRFFFRIRKQAMMPHLPLAMLKPCRNGRRSPPHARRPIAGVNIDMPAP